MKQRLRMNTGNRARLKPAIAILLVFLLGFNGNMAAATEVRVKGLFKGSAVLVINGKQRLLKVGKTSPEGVRLLAADSQMAEVEVDGRRRVLRLSRQIGTAYKKPEKAEVRIQSGRGGHYFTPGRINGQAVQFMVDTGATSVAMSLPAARRLGLNYRAGTRISVSTANGVGQAYRIMLRSVTVGNVRVDNVEAVVAMGDFPTTILLGNSYLSRVELNRDNGVLVLTSKY